MYVFTLRGGPPILPGEVSIAFAQFVKKHKLPKLTLHGLRHAYATLGLIAGISPKIVSEALGHSTVAITFDLYSHILPSMKEEHGNQIANLLRRPA